MADGFDRMIEEARQFFAELATNNNRAWYEEHKDRYVAGVKKPAEFFADLMAEDIGRATGQSVKSKVFRIHRDVRFSKDKTPYKTHLHILWAPVDSDAMLPRWFFGVAQDYCILGMGLMGLQGDAITRYRRRVDQNGDAIRSALNESSARLSTWGPEPLKRVPKPYAQDHPHAELLKRKSLAVHADIPEDWHSAGLVKLVNDQVKGLLPIYRALASD